MAVITGNNLRNRLTGTAAADKISGFGGNDVLRGLGGTDTLIGGAGADTLDGGSGGDRMSGGTGNDTYIVDNAADKTIELANQGVDTVKSSITWTLRNHTETLVLTGSASRDGTGNALANTLTGNGGHNQLFGLDGNDVISGGNGNDILVGGSGGDVLRGGDGIDTASYVNAASGLHAFLNSIAANTGDAAGDSYDGIENLIGSNDAGNGDLLGGDSGNNRIEGLAGNDTIFGDNVPQFSPNFGDDTLLGGDGGDYLDGEGGDDTLDGGAGNDFAIIGRGGVDTMTGGAGADVFRYYESTDSGVDANNRDIITDFEIGADKIELWRAFVGLTFVGVITATGFGGAVPEVGFTHPGGTTTIVKVDSDGDGGTDLEIELTGVITLSSGDFVLTA
ncbi:MAG: calcium-binding protein [Hyphomicrobiaceae bacterium]